MVRDHVGRRYGKTSQCRCTSVFHNAETPCPRVSCVRVFECEVRVFECETVHIFSPSDLIGLPQGSEGNFATRRTSQAKFTTKAPIIPPTGPVERTLFLGPSVGTLVTFLLAWDFSVPTGKCFRPARATRQGGGSFVNAMWLAGSKRDRGHNG